MRLDWTISACFHLTILVVGSLTFVPARPATPPVQSIPVNIVSDTTQTTQGLTTGQKDKSKPFADKVGERKPVEDPVASISKKEVTAATDVATPPPEPKPQPKKKSEPKRDPIAEAIKKDDARKAEPKKVEPKKAEAKASPKPPQTQPKFDPRKVEALLDKRTPRRKESSGDEVSDSPPLGASKGSEVELSQDELTALMKRLMDLWSPPEAARNQKNLVIDIRLQLRPDGSLAAPPRVLTSGDGALFMASRDTAIRAVFRGAPYTMLRPETYEKWKEIDVRFDPRELSPG